jgi:hypothetical protein
MTQINGTQIKDAAITQTKLSLVDGAAATDAVTVRQLYAFLAGRAIKFPVRVATVAAGDVPFSSYNSGTGTITTTATVTAIDGVTLAVGDRVLLKNYTSTNAPYNGIYTVTSLTGTTQFTRAADASTSQSSPASYTDVVVGMLVGVDDGTANAGNEYTLAPPTPGAAPNVTLGTSALNFTKVGGATTSYAGGNGISVAGTTITAVGDGTNAVAVGAAGIQVKVKASGGTLIDSTNGLYVDSAAATGFLKYSNYVMGEVPTGTVNGSNTAFHVNGGAAVVAVEVFLNGQRQTAGGDYTLTAASGLLTFSTAPASGDGLICNYTK